MKTKKGFTLENVPHSIVLGLEPRRSRRHPEIHLHDLDFADDIALLASTIEKAESLLHSVESASNAVGLHLKFSMKERQTHFFSTLGQTNNIKTKKGFTLENVPHSRVLCLEPRRSRRHPEIRLHDLDFADDIALLASTIEKAESLLHSVESASNAVGLRSSQILNEGKTKALLLNTGPNKQHQDKERVYTGECSSFQVPWIMYQTHSLILNEGKHRRGRHVINWKQIWKSNLNWQNKINVFKAFV